ncbi:MAG: EVE domain-containing protein [Candidatus Latescibacterota bacterium]|nr:EVE domain-containing protein [Candidatus Latescibacterota bacterium]
MAKNYWLVKCEFDECSFDDLRNQRRNSTGQWRGVRNYQARNFIRDGMSEGDLAFFYQSNCNEPGIAGVVTIIRAGYPDPSQLEKRHKYYDEKSNADQPRWWSFDVKWKRKFKNFVHLADLKANDRLLEMRVVQKGQRLSIQPVTAKEWNEVCKMGGVVSPP